MKGRFSLNVNDMSILFGNLGSESHNIDQYQLCELEHIHHEGGRLIAHDVIEHTVAHRTNKWISVESELRALGAVKFVRCDIDITYDIIHQLGYLGKNSHRPMPPKREMMPDLTEDILVDMENEDLEPDRYIAEWAMAQLNYGYWQKHDQYGGNQSKAWNDFHFIQENSNGVISQLQDVHWERDVQGISCYFDTDRHIFRQQFKYQ
jgi:hypothetical protein